jgi:hypothetical protein
VRRCDKGTIMSFLRYICETCNILKTESLRQYWKQFQMLYKRINSFKLGSKDDQKGLGMDISLVRCSH